MHVLHAVKSKYTFSERMTGANLQTDSVTLTTLFRSGIKSVNRAPNILTKAGYMCFTMCLSFCANTTVILAKFNTHTQ